MVKTRTIRFFKMLCAQVSAVTVRINRKFDGNVAGKRLDLIALACLRGVGQNPWLVAGFMVSTTTTVPPILLAAMLQHVMMTMVGKGSHCKACYWQTHMLGFLTPVCLCDVISVVAVFMLLADQHAGLLNSSTSCHAMPCSRVLPARDGC
jgi:hypothetical protein